MSDGGSGSGSGSGDDDGDGDDNDDAARQTRGEDLYQMLKICFNSSAALKLPTTYFLPTTLEPLPLTIHYYLHVGSQKVHT